MASAYQSDIDVKPLARTGWLADIHDEGDLFRLKQNYDLSNGTIIGKGGNGSVSIIKKKSNGEAYALKTVATPKLKDAAVRQELMKEIEMQSAMDHPNIVKVYEAYEDPLHGKMYLIMELCTGGDLCARIRQPNNRHGFGERGCATLMEEMLSAVHYCHAHGVVHRDIKLDNFMFEDPSPQSQLKLIDFGFACEVSPGHEKMWDKLGTPSYMAPELWDVDKSGRHLKHAYNSSVDMWALGVTCYFLLCGQRPWFHQDLNERARMICEDPVPFTGHEWKGISDDAKDFVSKLLAKNHQERLSAKDALDHRWIRGTSSVHEVDSAADLARHDEVVKALQNFANTSALQKVALEVIAFSTPPAKMKELREIFIHMDTDSKGTITKEQFRHAMTQHPEIPVAQVDILFNSMDQTHSGEVDYSEFLAATLSSQQSMDAPCVATVFGLLDKDGDGFVTADDLVEALGCREEDSFQKHEIELLLQQGAGITHPEGDKPGQRRHHAHEHGEGVAIKLSPEDFKFLLLQRESSEKGLGKHHKHGRLDELVDKIGSHFHFHAKAKHAAHHGGK